MRGGKKVNVLALIGCPVAHSKSPRMFNTAFQDTQLPYVYLAHHVEPHQLERAVNGLKTLGYEGFNVTIPYKEAMMNLVDELDESAQVIGAINTVVHREGKWIGYNTDGAGYLRSLRESIAIDLNHCKVVMIGAGGAARAVGYALCTHGIQHLTIVNRTVKKANELANQLASRGQTNFLALADAEEVIAQADLIINTTSVGMHPHTKQSPIPIDWIGAHHIVSDLVYNPLHTALLQGAEKKGAKIHTGDGMLLYQAAIAWELWTSRPAPIPVMKKALEQANSYT
ncbi:shikimate dehydrogenase [Hazenella sp. IB182353]|nr:shikimate dehydrogenase [Polycladospora coralii]